MIRFLIIAAIISFGLGCFMNMPSPETGYTIEQVRAMDKLVARATTDSDWLTDLQERTNDNQKRAIKLLRTCFPEGIFVKNPSAKCNSFKNRILAEAK